MVLKLKDGDEKTILTCNNNSDIIKKDSKGAIEVIKLSVVYGFFAFFVGAPSGSASAERYRLFW